MIIPLAFLLLAPPQDALVAKGFDHFYNVEYPEAVDAFRRAVEAAPNDPRRRTHLAQAVLFLVMERAGALESEMVTGANSFLRRPRMEPKAGEDALFHEQIDTALRLADQKLKSNPNDPEALYAQGVALGLRGTWRFLVRKSWMDALRDITNARKAHNRVVELQPGNIDARMLQGVHDYIVGSLPLAYKVLGFLAGFRGNREAGMETLRLVAAKGDENKIDAAILLGAILRRERRPREVIPILEDLRRRYPRNYLVQFELSQMYADLGDLEQSLAALDRLVELKKSGASGFRRVPNERIELARGNVLFWYEKPAQAIPHLKSATAGAELLDPNSVQLAWVRLGQCLDLTGRRAEAKAAFSRAAELKPPTELTRSSRRFISTSFTMADKRKMDLPPPTQ
ncbi:MAG: tetratricopeptide repeat protein [Bryobacteraceae bacterium]|nr:tetratricopeptide repeat protein [Bryobacteraceae bacterium]